MAKSTTDEFRSALKNRKTLSSLSNGEDNDFLSSTEERLEKAERKMITPGTSQWVAKVTTTEMRGTLKINFRFSQIPGILRWPSKPPGD